jgi:hypothetical protein
MVRQIMEDSKNKRGRELARNQKGKITRGKKRLETFPP